MEAVGFAEPAVSVKNLELFIKLAFHLAAIHHIHKHASTGHANKSNKHLYKALSLPCSHSVGSTLTRYNSTKTCIKIHTPKTQLGISTLIQANYSCIGKKHSLKKLITHSPTGCTLELISSSQSILSRTEFDSNTLELISSSQPMLFRTIFVSLIGWRQIYKTIRPQLKIHNLST